MLALVLGAAVLLTVAYFTYGRLLSRLLKLDPNTTTPAVAQRDGVDYVPIETGSLLSQHFSAIAAAGPIVGPILAGAMFGWLPALIWILVGSILIGGVHDFTALVASIRHRALSIAEVVRQHMSRRSFVLFLAFVWLALLYIIVAFTDITASTFVGALNTVDGTVYKSASDVPASEAGNVVLGGGIATSSLLYLLLPVLMALVVKFGKISLNTATWFFLPLVGVAIWGGQFLPIDVDQLIQSWWPDLPKKTATLYAVRTWDVLLLAYCCIASIVPMWLLLQPRGQLGGYFLYAALIAGAVGLLAGGQPIQMSSFKGWEFVREGRMPMALVPFLFITIACGACSGFHSLIASGTTSKQLRNETDARPIGYGAMLLEAMVALVSLCCAMMLADDSPLLKNPKPDLIYAQGIGRFLGMIGLPASFGVAFALMAFTTFIYDTLDVCTRLGRYIIQELTGWHDSKGKWLGTILTAAIPVYFVMQSNFDKDGNPIPVWLTFWTLFGASNQLLAALTLLGVTVWLWRTKRAKWVWFVTGIPTVWMYAMSSWALVGIIRFNFANGVTANPVPWVAVVLVVLAVLMLIEAIRVIAGIGSQPSPPSPAPVIGGREAMA